MGDVGLTEKHSIKADELSIERMHLGFYFRFLHEQGTGLTRMHVHSGEVTVHEYIRVLHNTRIYQATWFICQYKIDFIGWIEENSGIGTYRTLSLSLFDN